MSPFRTGHLHAAPPVTWRQSARPPLASAVGPLHATRDVRQVIRLLQCRICSRILRRTTTLPHCGHSLCRRCLPPLHVRHNISWPAKADRVLAFKCPFANCGKEHLPQDCAHDIALDKAVAEIKAVLEVQPPTGSCDVETHMLIEPALDLASESGEGQRQTRCESVLGSKMLATFTLAESGNLGYDDEVTYSSTGVPADVVVQLDDAVFRGLKEAVREEFDCTVCFGLYVHPQTTACGHTFCRACLQQDRKVTSNCPTCREPLSLHPDLAANQRICNIIDEFWPDSAAARAQTAHTEQLLASSSEPEPELDWDTVILHQNTPFPSQNLPAIDIGGPQNRWAVGLTLTQGLRFGVVFRPSLLNSTLPETGIGTIVHVISKHTLDGKYTQLVRSTSHFRVMRYGWVSGFVVAQTEFVHDISWTEEEAIEAAETMEAGGVQYFTTRPGHFGPICPPPLRAPTEQNLHSLSTQELYEGGKKLLAMAGELGKLSTRVAHMVLGMGRVGPPRFVAFAYIVAELKLMPLYESYAVLRSRSVRQRLKIAVYWLLKLVTATEVGWASLDDAVTPYSAEDDPLPSRTLGTAPSSDPAPEPVSDLGLDVMSDAVSAPGPES